MTPSNIAGAKSIRPFPTVSILAILTVPLCMALSWPLWSWWVDHQVQTGSDGMYAPDPGQFNGFAIAGAVVATGAAASILGLLAAWLAGRRNERWQGLRLFALVANALAAALGVFLLVSCLMKLGSH